MIELNQITKMNRVQFTQLYKCLELNQITGRATDFEF